MEVRPRLCTIRVHDQQCISQWEGLKVICVCRVAWQFSMTCTLFLGAKLHQANCKIEWWMVGSHQKTCNININVIIKDTLLNQRSLNNPNREGWRPRFMKYLFVCLSVPLCICLWGSVSVSFSLSLPLLSQYLCLFACFLIWDKRIQKLVESNLHFPCLIFWSYYLET